MDNYRLLEQRDEILKMVKKAPVLEMGEIWQTLPMKREIYRINNLEVMNESLVFVTTAPFEFEAQAPIYIKLNYKNLVFKLSADEYRVFNNQLSCVIPKEAKAIEERKMKRTIFPKKSALTVTLRTLSPNSALDIKVNLEDVSESGLGVKSSNLNQDYFKRNSFFKIIEVCGREYTEDLILTVRHVSEQNDRSLIGIGFSASATFSDHLYEILREEMKNKLSKKL